MLCVHAVEEQLFRSVEGQAESDEEEERWTGEQQRQVDEVKRILTRLSCCGDRYISPLLTISLKKAHVQLFTFIWYALKIKWDPNMPRISKWLIGKHTDSIFYPTCFGSSCVLCALRCDEKAVKKLLSHFSDSRTEESQTAVLELLERVIRLNKQLELKESQAKRAEMDTDQVWLCSSDVFFL